MEEGNNIIPPAQNRKNNKRITNLLLVIGLAGLLYFVTRPPLMHRLSNQHYELPLPQIRPANPPAADSIYLSGMNAFSNRQWDDAIAAFEKVSSDHRFYERALYYTGHAYVAKKIYQHALSIFSNPVLANGQYKNHAALNVILMKMRLQYPEEEIMRDLESFVPNENQTLNGKASEILEKLKK